MSSSLKARSISFMAMWAVVAWHCYCGSDIERWFIPTFCYWSVPWFFVVSGFFFVRSFEKRSLKDFAVSKIKSIAIPYVIWCVLGFIVFLFLCPREVHFTPVSVFALGKAFQPTYNPPLWYMRALAIFTVFGSLAMFVARFLWLRNEFLRCGVSVALFGIIYWLAVNCAGLSVGPGSSPVYFIFGMCLSYLGKREKVVTWLDRNGLYMGLLSLVFAVAARSVWFVQGHSFSFAGAGGTIIGNFCTLMMIIAIWTLLDRVPTAKSLKNYAGVGVFVYLMHRPLLMCIIENVSPCLVDHNTFREMLFIALVVFYVPFCLCIDGFLKRFTPRMYSVLIGGR